jgi:Ser/Thr protein kinase RdoA (MazF antagonist)
MTGPLDTLPEPERLAAFDELARVALAPWGLQSASLRRIACRENAVYEVTATDGARSALRVHRHGYHSRASLQSEFDWMRALVDEAGVVTAGVVPTLAGEAMVEMSTAAIPQPHLCDMLEWIDGRPLGLADRPETLGQGGVFERYRTVGTIAGRIHRHAATWQSPAGFVRSHWDREGCLGAAALWGPWFDLAVLTDAERGTLHAAVSQIDPVLERLGRGREVYGMVHADFVPDNLFEDRAGRIIVLDLDDAGFGWYLWELVTAVFWYLGTPHYTPALDGYLAGYREVAPLSDEHLRLLPHFLLMRALVYMGWMETRRTQHTSRMMTQRVRELSLQLARRLLDGETGFRDIPLTLTPLPASA